MYSIIYYVAADIEVLSTKPHLELLFLVMQLELLR